MTSVGVMASAVVVGADELLEPFNDFTTNAWTISGPPTIVAGGRTGTAAQSTATTATMIYTIPAARESDTLTLGFAVNFANIGNGTFLELQSDAGVTVHNNMRVAPGGIADGSFNFRRGTTVLGTAAAGTLTVSTWHYIEIRVRLHDTLGTLEVRVDGVAKIGPLSSQDTKNAGTKTTYDRLRMSSNIGAATKFDDLYLTTGTASAFKGPITIP